MVQMLQFSRVAVLSLLLTVGVPGPVIASGSDSADGNQAAYEHGKSIMHRQLGCDACELGQLPESAGEARRVLERLEAGAIGTDLAERDRRAVIHYLQQRWQL